MSQLFQIYESDLADLEQLLPQLAARLMPSMDNALRIKIRRCQKIMTDVRWNYGPPSHVGRIDADSDSGEYHAL